MSSLMPLPHTSPTQALLVEKRVASRIHASDASLYDFSAQAVETAQNFMGWTQLASNPSADIDDIQQFAQTCIDEGLTRVILIGEGGSSQAPMTITKINAALHPKIRFSTLDSLSPLYLKKIMDACDVATTIFLVSSKSGSTIETLSLFQVLWRWALEQFDGDVAKAGSRFVAITDPGTNKLTEIAEKCQFRRVFYGVTSVGGRFSALSVFGLVPTALVGIDLKQFLARAAEMELACAEDVETNPAIELATFLYDNLSTQSGLTFSYMSPQAARVFGLWLEQLVAESLGKDGKGIVPQIEINPVLLNPPYSARPCVAYNIPALDENAAFERDLAQVSERSPLRQYTICDTLDIGVHFVLWEYATSMLGYLMQVCPFDQPDVQLAKVNTARALHGMLPAHPQTVAEPWLIYEHSGFVTSKDAPNNLHELLCLWLEQISLQDYVSINAFLPFTGERRFAIERIRHAVASRLGNPTCLEIGPRYLHSTGQLHKGGPNHGVFLIISANEQDVITVPHEDYTLGELAIAQAKGDLATLTQKDRRALHIHLISPDDDPIERLAVAIEEAAEICARYPQIEFLASRSL